MEQQNKKSAPRKIDFKASRSSRDNQRAHVIKRGDNWAVKKEGNTKASRLYPTQGAAIKGAQTLRSQGHDVIVHEKDGSVQDWQKKF